MYKLLIADDEWLQREALKIILKKCEIELDIVAEASNGKEALDMFEKTNPDILLLDIKMPLMDGITLSEIIKSKHPKKRIIILTAYEEYDLIRKALIVGVNDYVLKPIKDEELLKVLKNQMDFLDGNNNNKKITNKTLKPILEYIEKNYKEDISLEKAASICNLSIYYFSKLFKKHMGMNFVTYVSKCKMNHAKEMLKDTDMSIVNIALELGYYDSAYFTKVFKKIENITPTQYRKKFV